MKTHIKIFTLLITLTIVSVILPKQTFAQQNNVSLQVFYDELSPYGQWVNYLDYGYVWIPDVGPNFVPYSTAGHWIHTEFGWTWVSDYVWGWAPFHYGRWLFDNYYGWLWVPGNEWGPAWVTWRSSNGYFGWAPIGPGLDINGSFNRPYNANNDYWMFVRANDFDSPDLSLFYISRGENERIIASSMVINNTYYDNGRSLRYISGPPREEVQRITGRNINTVVIRENNTPGQNMSSGQLMIYRPQVQKISENKTLRPVPTKVVNIKEVRRPSERSTINQTDINRQERNPNNISPQNDSRYQHPNTQNQPENNIQQSTPNNPNPQNSYRQEQPNNQTLKDNINQGRNQNFDKKNQPKSTKPPTKIKPIRTQNSSSNSNKKK